MTAKSGAGPVLINRARRAVIKPGRLGACIVTGTDKLRSGFGNGDCLMLDFKNLVFAVSDATERFPAASHSFLTRLSDALAEAGNPGGKTDWLDLINAVYARQSYHLKTTLSCVAVNRGKGAATAYVIHGGDSIVMLLDLETRKAQYTTSADMCFAGQSKELLCVDEVPIKGGNCAFIIASDGIADAVRFSGQTLEKISGSVLSRFPIHEIAEGLADYLNDLPGPVEYDDIGLIAFSPTELESEDRPTILVGGTTPVEEAAFQKKLSEKSVDDTWLSIDALESEEPGSASPDRIVRI